MTYAITIFLELIFLFFLSKLLTRTLTQFLYLLKLNQSWCTIIIAILFLPGTIVHELAHWLMAKIVFVPTGKISLFPKLEGSTIRMGSVQVAKVDPLRSLLIGVAPFITGIAIIFTSFYFLLPLLPSLDYVRVGLFVYILFVITNSMFSSKKDLDGSLVLIIICIFLLVIFYFLDTHLLLHLQAAFSLIPSHYLLLTVYYLLFPIALDTSIIIVLRLLIRISI